MNWIDITKLDQIENLNLISSEAPVLIFKHSNRCAVSKFALKNFENTFRNEKGVKCYFIDVVVNRDCSIAVANKFGVVHESPQILILYKNKVVYNASHEMIDGELVEKLFLKI